MEGESSIDRSGADSSNQPFVFEQQGSNQSTVPLPKTSRQSGSTQEPETFEACLPDNVPTDAQPPPTGITEVPQPGAVGAGVTSSSAPIEDPSNQAISNENSPQESINDPFPFDPMEDSEEEVLDDAEMISDSDDSSVGGESETAATGAEAAAQKQRDSSVSDNEDEHLRKLLLPSAPAAPPSRSSIAERAIQERGALRERPLSQSQSQSPRLTASSHRQSILRHMIAREWGAVPRAACRRAPTAITSLMGSLAFVQRLQLDCSLEQHDGCVNALNFNQRGTLLASASDDLDVILWDLSMQKSYVSYHSGHYANVFQCKFMPKSSDIIVVSCARDGQVRVAELSSDGVCHRTRRVARHNGAAHKLATITDEPHVLLSAGEDSVIFQVDLRTSKPGKFGCVYADDPSGGSARSAQSNGAKVPLYSIHSNPCNTNEFCASGRDPAIRVYDRRFLQKEEDLVRTIKKFAPHHLASSSRTHVTCAVYNYNGTELLASYNDEDIYLFDATHSDGDDSIHVYTGHRNSDTVKGVNFYGPLSQYVVSGSDSGNVYFWDKETSQIVHFILADKVGAVNVLEPHPSIPIIATSGLEHSVKVWSPTAPRALLDTDAVRSFLWGSAPKETGPGVGSSPAVGPTGRPPGPSGGQQRKRRRVVGGGLLDPHGEEGGTFASEYTRFVAGKRPPGATGAALEEAESAAWERASQEALAELRRQIQRNVRTRSAVADADEDHGDLLFFLMRHLRRSAMAQRSQRARQRQAGHGEPSGSAASGAAGAAERAPHEASEGEHADRPAESAAGAGTQPEGVLDDADRFFRRVLLGAQPDSDSSDEEDEAGDEEDEDEDEDVDTSPQAGGAEAGGRRSRRGHMRPCIPS